MIKIKLIKGKKETEIKLVGGKYTITKENIETWDKVEVSEV